MAFSLSSLSKFIAPSHAETASAPAVTARDTASVATERSIREPVGDHVSRVSSDTIASRLKRVLSAPRG